MTERREKTPRLTASLDEIDYAARNAMAARSDVSLSWIIWQAIQRFVREHSDQSKLPLTLLEQADSEEVSG